MKKLLLALLAAGFASATVGVLAADNKEPYTALPKIDKPGRAADEASGTPPKSTTSHKKSSKKKKSTAPAPSTDAPKQ
jgi:hypothetical protein